MFDTYRVYEELSQSMDENAAKALVSILGNMFKDLQNTVTKDDFKQLQVVVQELAEAQKRTEARLDSLTQRMEELAEAQKRTEARLDSLAQRMEELAEAQKRTEKAVFTLARNIEKTNKNLAGLSDTVGYTLENESYKYLPKLLLQDYGIKIEGDIYRDYMDGKKGGDIEVNILGKGTKGEERLLIVGESKSQLSKNNVDTFIRKKLNIIDFNGLKIFPILVTHMVSQRDTIEYARGKGVTIYLSYQFK